MPLDFDLTMPDQELLLRLVSACKPVWKKGETAFYDSDYEKQLRKAALQALGPVTVRRAYALLKLLTAVYSMNDEDDPEHELYAGAVWAGITAMEWAMANSEPADASDVKARAVYLVERIADDEENGPSIFTLETAKRLKRDLFYFPPVKHPRYEEPALSSI